MRTRLTLASALMLALLPGALADVAITAQQPAAAAPTWEIDPQRSEVRFTVTKLGFADVTGIFRESSGTIAYDRAIPAASQIAWRVQVASVLTDASNRDRALQSREYFHAAEHPQLVFESTGVRPQADGSLHVDGRITIRGVTRPLTVHVRPNLSGPSPTFDTRFELDRYDFGVLGGTMLGRMIARRVRVHLIAATRPA